MKHIARKIGNPKYAMLTTGVALVLFDVNYYLMSVMPGSRDMMCVMGVNLTPGNIVFAVVLSLMTAVLVAGLVALFAKKAAERKVAMRMVAAEGKVAQSAAAQGKAAEGRAAEGKAAMASLSGVGLGVGLLTVFCPVCALPLISVAGASVVFQAFNDYNVVFKVVSLVLLAVALFLLNRQLSDDCKECVFVPESSAPKKAGK